VGFKSPFHLWKQKLGLIAEDEVNEKMRRGMEMEAEARDSFCVEMKMFYKPAVVVHDNGWMMASIDGLSDCKKYAVEIKCGESAHKKALQGIIPEYYQAQMQHQMYVLGINKMFYYTYIGTHGIILEVYKDDDFIAKMLEKEKQFWDWVQNPQTSEFAEKCYEERNSQEWKDAAAAFKEAAEMKEIWNAKYDEYRKILIDLSDDMNSRGCGIKITKTIRKGSIEYEKVQQLKGVDLEPHRKPPITVWNIGIEK